MAGQGQSKAVPWKRGSVEREVHWRQALADWSGSGLSKVAFCRKRGLSPSAFHWWKGELARRDAAKGSRGAGASSGTSREPDGGQAFVAVRVTADAVRGAGERLGSDGGVAGAVEVVLRSGRRVRVGSGFDGELLARVVQVLEGLAC